MQTAGRLFCRQQSKAVLESKQVILVEANYHTHGDCRAVYLQVTSNYFIFVPSFLGALLTLTAVAVCMAFPR